MEQLDEPTPIAPGAGKRIMTIGVGVLVLGLIVQLIIGQTTLGGPILLLGLAIVIPLVAAVWASKRRATSVWSPVLFGLLGGAAQVLAILIPLLVTSMIYPDPRHPVGSTLLFGAMATALSAAVGAVVGGLVCLILNLFGSRAVESSPLVE